MKAMIHIWGYGTFHNIGTIKTEKDFKALQQQIENAEWDSSEYDDSCNAEVDSFHSISPDDAILTVYEMKGKKVTDKKIYECNVDELSYKCFNQTFNDYALKTKHYWHFTQTSKGVFFWSDITVTKKEPFDPKKLQINVIHQMFNGRIAYSKIDDVYYGEEDFGMSEESNLRFGPYCKLNAV